MTHRAVNAHGIFIALLLLALGPLSAAAAGADHFFALNTGDLKAELADARADGKKALLVFFEQEGCPGCRHMKQNVFNVKEVQDYYHQTFTSLAVDIHGSVPMKDVAGRELSEKGYAQALKIRATPTFVFYDLGGTEIVRIVGPLQTPEEFLLLGRFVASGAYKTLSFAQYRGEKQTEHRKKTSMLAPSPTGPLPRAPLPKGEGRFDVQTR